MKDLGKGAFGKVKLVKDTKDGNLYALKIMDKMVLKKKRQGMTNMLESVQKEIAIMKKISHPNCVHMYEVCSCSPAVSRQDHDAAHAWEDNTLPASQILGSEGESHSV